jgi:hypothetical protein
MKENNFMKHTALINITFGIYPIQNEKFQPSQKLFGKAVGTISGSTIEECETKLREMIKKAGFSITSETRAKDAK